jgi:hypothetical protein
MATVSALDFSRYVGTTAVAVYTADDISNGTPIFMRLWNVAEADGGTIWLTRSDELGLGITENAPGAFPLAPGEFEVFQLPQSIPDNDLFAIATDEDTPLTVEVWTEKQAQSLGSFDSFSRQAESTEAVARTDSADAARANRDDLARYGRIRTAAERKLTTGEKTAAASRLIAAAKERR